MDCSTGPTSTACAVRRGQKAIQSPGHRCKDTHKAGLVHLNVAVGPQHKARPCPPGLLLLLLRRRNRVCNTAVVLSPVVAGEGRLHAGVPEEEEKGGNALVLALTPPAPLALRSQQHMSGDERAQASLSFAWRTEQGRTCRRSAADSNAALVGMPVPESRAKLDMRSGSLFAAWDRSLGPRVLAWAAALVSAHLALASGTQARYTPRLRASL